MNILSVVLITAIWNIALTYFLFSNYQGLHIKCDEPDVEEFRVATSTESKLEVDDPTQSTSGDSDVASSTATPAEETSPKVSTAGDSDVATSTSTLSEVDDRILSTPSDSDVASSTATPAEETSPKVSTAGDPDVATKGHETTSFSTESVEKEPKPYTFPYIARLQFMFRGEEINYLLGTIVSPIWILTARTGFRYNSIVITVGVGNMTKKVPFIRYVPVIANSFKYALVITENMEFNDAVQSIPSPEFFQPEYNNSKFKYLSIANSIESIRKNEPFQQATVRLAECKEYLDVGYIGGFTSNALTPILGQPLVVVSSPNEHILIGFYFNSTQRLSNYRRCVQSMQHFDEIGDISWHRWSRLYRSS